MRQINLLPPELAARRRSRQLLGVVVIAGAALVGLLVIIYGAQQARLSSAKHRLTVQEQTNARLQRQVRQLSQFSQQQTLLKAKQALLGGATKSEVLWSTVLSEISLVIPPDDWLTNFTANTAPQGATGTPTGTMQVSGCTLVPPDGDHLNVALFLIQIAKPLTFADDPFLTLTSKSEDLTCPVQFNATIALTDQALRAKQPGKERKV